MKSKTPVYHFFIILFNFLIIIFLSYSSSDSSIITQVNSYSEDTFMAGAFAIDLTRYDFEKYIDDNLIEGYDPSDFLFDTGIDSLFDYEEPNAFGKDGKPGKAGVDDDGNGIIDDCTRPTDKKQDPYANCKEYLAKKSDDIKDPNKDNFSIFNKNGTEGNKRYDGFGLAGFGPNIPFSYRATNWINDQNYNDGFKDGIWGRAIALKKGEQTVVILSMDYAGMFHNYMNIVKRKISLPISQGGLGIPPYNVIMTTTHNHNSPDAYGFWDLAFGGTDKNYMLGAKKEVDENDYGVTDKMFLAVKMAVKNLKPAMMKSVQGEHLSCFDIDTLELKRDSECNLSDNQYENFHPFEYGLDQFFNQNDLRDPWVRNTEITLLHFVELDAPSKTIATVINYSNHPEVLGSAVKTWESSDYVHYVRKKLEKTYGGVSIFLIGTQGTQIGYLRNSTPVTRYTHEGKPVCLKNTSGECIKDPHGRDFPEFVYQKSPEKVWSMGYFIADSAIEFLENDTSPYLTDPKLEVKTRYITLEATEPAYKALICELYDEFEDIDKPRFKTTKNEIECNPHIVNFCISKAFLDYCQVFVDNIQLNIVTIGKAQFVTAPMESDPVYLLGRKSSYIEYHEDDFHDVCNFPEKPALKEIMTGEHNFMVSMANSYFSYGFPESDYVGYLNTKHPNYYEDGVTMGKEFGDIVANELADMLGDKSKPYTDHTPACQNVTK